MNDEIKRIISMIVTMNTNMYTINTNMNTMNKNIGNIYDNTNNMDNNINEINNKINKESQHEMLLERLDKIESLLEKTNSRLEKVENTLQIVNNSTKNMDEHINFVENVYTVVKKPFATLLGFYYNKNMNGTLQMPKVSVRNSTLERITLNETNEYEIVETFSETEND
jgi:chromosome segregation ATPase